MAQGKLCTEGFNRLKRMAEGAHLMPGSDPRRRLWKLIWRH